MFKRKNKKKKNVDFLLQSSHYRRLHLYLYFLSLAVILSIYFLMIMIFSDSSITIVVMSIISLLVGIYFVLNRDELVRRVSEKLEERKRKTIKKTDVSNLKTTLRKITPKNKRLKLNITSKVPLRERISNFRNNLKQKNEKVDSKGKKKVRPDYIEIK